MCPVTRGRREYHQIERTGDGSGALVRIRLAPGWHINSKRPRQAFLLPTRLDIDGVAGDAIRHPRATMRKLGFYDEPLSLYEGDVDIVARLPASAKRKQVKRVKLHIQACRTRRALC